ncbi:hypothetical protein [Cellulomonas timonensis]|uniref:hypothetical protein n=1 Tax=Cellulomonas timonensis TaxID=1689271 RepID=UPI0008351FB1|nr:hypothetical protein [Cellulomonas timonensis]
MLDPELSRFVEAVSGPFCESKPDMATMRSISGGAFVASLMSVAAVQAAWADLVEAARDGDDAAMLWGAECLEAQLTARGFTGKLMLSGAASALVGQLPANTVGPIPPVEMRVQTAEHLLASDPETGRCVAWLTYDEAMPDDFTSTYGTITFLEADWCLPNAIREDGRPFPFRDEVRALAAKGIDWEFDGENWKPDRSRRPYIVLARVDLGDRATTEAIEHAGELVQLMIDVSRLQGGGRPWRRAGPAVLVVDGQGSSTWHDSPEVGAGDPSESYGRRVFAESLAEHGPLVGNLLSRPIAPDLAEAVRMLGEAGQADDPWRPSGYRRTIDRRTVLALHDSAHDHLATYARCSGDELAARVCEGWPTMRWSREVVKAINACLSWENQANPALDSAVRTHGTYHFDVASDRLDELLAAAGDDHTRRTARRWLASIDDATAHVELLDTLADQCELLAGRTKRVRNGIAHGTPPSAEVTESVMEYSRWRVFRALHYAMQAATTGRLMLDVLDEEIQSRHGELAALKVGVSMRQQWAAAR